MNNVELVIIRKTIFIIWLLTFLLSCSPKPVEQKESTLEIISFPKEGSITVPFTENQGQLAEEVLFYAQITQGKNRTLF